MPCLPWETSGGSTCPKCTVVDSPPVALPLGWWVHRVGLPRGTGGRAVPHPSQGRGGGVTQASSCCLPTHRAPHCTCHRAKGHCPVRTGMEETRPGRPCSVTPRTLPGPNPQGPMASSTCGLLLLRLAKPVPPPPSRPDWTAGPGPSHLASDPSRKGRRMGAGAFLEGCSVLQKQPWAAVFRGTKV